MLLQDTQRYVVLKMLRNFIRLPFVRVITPIKQSESKAIETSIPCLRQIKDSLT
jgi:hypothetical protein